MAKNARFARELDPLRHFTWRAEGAARSENTSLSPSFGLPPIDSLGVRGCGARYGVRACAKLAGAMQLISARLASRPWGMIMVHCGNANDGETPNTSSPC